MGHGLPEWRGFILLAIVYAEQQSWENMLLSLASSGGWQQPEFNLKSHFPGEKLAVACGKRDNPGKLQIVN